LAKSAFVFPFRERITLLGELRGGQNFTRPFFAELFKRIGAEQRLQIADRLAKKFREKRSDRRILSIPK
jgi:hypothetical protein